MRTIHKIKMIILTAIGILIAMHIGTALADSEPIDITIVPVPTPEPIPYTAPIEVTDHYLDQREVETLAEFLWKSPLRYESTKRTLLWVVFNRVDDKSGLFDDNIEDVCRNRAEFGFMEAHRYKLSEDNLRIVREEMNRWKSLHDGKWVGRHVPRNGVYCAFHGDRNRLIDVYSEIGGQPLTW